MSVYSRKETRDSLLNYSCQDHEIANIVLQVPQKQKI